MKPNKKIGIDKTFEEGIKGILKPVKDRMYTFTLNRKAPTYPTKDRGSNEVLGLSMVGYSHIEVHSKLATNKIFGVKFQFQLLDPVANSGKYPEGNTLWIIDGDDKNKVAHIFVDTKIKNAVDVIFFLPEESLDFELSFDVFVNNKPIPKDTAFYKA